MKREPTVLLAIAGLSLAFAIVSLLVWFSRGNSKLVARKLRLGALLIGLTGATTGCPVASCYETAAPRPDTLVLADGLQNGSTIEVKAGEAKKLTARIEQRLCNYFSFEVSDDRGALALAGPVQPIDGAFDSPTEEVGLTLFATDLQPGSYALRILADSGLELASLSLVVLAP